MSYRTPPPPEKSLAVTDKGFITPSWRELFVALFKKLGSANGTIQIVLNTVTTSLLTSDLRLGESEDDITFNNWTLDANLTENLPIGSFDDSTTATSVAILTAGLDSPTGCMRLTTQTTAPSGWLLLNDGTIGNASSGASTRANADTESLFTLLWNSISNTYAPVSSGRGASAAADFAANKTIRLPQILGRGLGLYGAGSGLTSRALGETVGEETHQLTTAEMPSHTHTWTDPPDDAISEQIIAPDADRVQDQSVPSVVADLFINTTVASGSAGSNTAHNNMQPTTFYNAIIKL